MGGEDLTTMLDMRMELAKLRDELTELQSSVRTILFAEESDANQEMMKLRLKWYNEGKSAQFHRNEEDTRMDAPNPT